MAEHPHITRHSALITAARPHDGWRPARDITADKPAPELHRAYDSHRLDLIGYLRPDEQIEAVRVLGLARAYRRLGGFVDA